MPYEGVYKPYKAQKYYASYCYFPHITHASITCPKTNFTSRSILHIFSFA